LGKDPELGLLSFLPLSSFILCVLGIGISTNPSTAMTHDLGSAPVIGAVPAVEWNLNVRVNP
jgi:hypothetical protein